MKDNAFLFSGLIGLMVGASFYFFLLIERWVSTPQIIFDKVYPFLFPQSLVIIGLFFGLGESATKFQNFLLHASLILAAISNFFLYGFVGLIIKKVFQLFR